MRFLCWFMQCHWIYLGAFQQADPSARNPVGCQGERGLYQCPRCKTLSIGAPTDPRFRPAIFPTMSEWQPIETAPKDETTVLLFCPQSWDTNGIRVGWWFEDGWYDDESASNPMTDITHWMPIPQPPTHQPKGDV